MCLVLMSIISQYCCCSVTKSCLTLFDPRDWSPPVHGILQTRILEWVAISFSRGSSQPRNETHVSCVGRQILNHNTELPVKSISQYFWAIKRNKIQSFVEMWMDLESTIQSEMSEKKYCILTHTCGIQKNDTEETICRAGIEMQA